MRRLALLPFLAAAACGGSPAAEPPARPVEPAPAAPPASPLADQAVAGVTDPALRALLADHWEWTLATSPEWATSLGDHRFDDRISDGSHAAVEAERAAAQKLLDRARAIDAGALEPADRVTLRLFVEELEHRIAMAVCQGELWNLSANNNPVTQWSYLPKRHPITGPDSARNLVARYRQIAGAIDAEIANLRLGLEQGLVANAESVRRVLRLVDDQLAEDDGDWALMEPAKVGHDALSADQQAALARDITAIVSGEIRPALARYRAVLADELVPRARAEVGLVALELGPACYAARIRNYTGLDRTARELHELGQREIAAINREMQELGHELFGTRELSAILARLRSDRALYFASADEIMARAKASLARARAAIPRFFGILPQADCVVVPIPDYEAPYTTIAYYRQPHPGSDKPGEYFVNTFAPETRPTFEAEVLAYHESIPGHHLQIAIAQERSELPAFRRHDGQTAFVEGWALYTERLADEMGLYSGDLDRMGMLSYDAWRAARLVVDTGIHALGWSREQAETFMLEHTALARNNIVNEVDRYIGWPGQALAYKVGQLEIWRLRRAAEAELGDAFDIRGFHDAVLAGGAVSLKVLRDQVAAWVRATREAAGSPG
jgi:uncharacterized protein (DUF885 family)